MRERNISHIKKIPVWILTHRVFHKKSAFSFARVRVHTPKATGCNHYPPHRHHSPIQPIMEAPIAPTRWSQKMGMRVQEKFKSFLVEWQTEKWGCTTNLGFQHPVRQINWYHYDFWLTGHQNRGFKTSSRVGRMQIPSGVSHTEHHHSVQTPFKIVST